MDRPRACSPAARDGCRSTSRCPAGARSAEHRSGSAPRGRRRDRWFRRWWSWPSVALRQALLEALLEEREEDGQDPVHDRREEQGLEAREVGRADGPRPPEQLLQRDERDERAVLDHRDELVAD